MMWVEFIGVPGVGKSICKQMLSEHLDQRGIAQTSDGELIAAACGSKAQSNRDPSTWKWVRRVNRISEHCIYRAKIRGQYLINHVKGRAKLLHAFRFQRLPCYWLAEQMLLMDYWRRSAGECDEKQIYVTSEGVAHLSAAVAVWSGSPCAEHALRRMQDKWKRSCVLVAVQSTNGIAFQRMMERGIPKSWPSKSNRRREVAREIHDRFICETTGCIGRLEDNGMTIFRVENSASLDRLGDEMARVADEIERLTTRHNVHVQEIMGQD